MKKRIKKLWIDALRSGEYEQGAGGLRTNNRFCCLGVLCDVFRRTTHKGRWRNEEFVAGGENRSGFLPKAVQEWAGIKDEDPKLHSKTASRLNDDKKDFNYIADRIEKYL